MKIAITAQGEGLDAVVDPRFGRAKCFVLVDVGNREVRNIDNTQNMNAMQGAGIQAVKVISDNGARALITGNVGPKAFTALNSAGIDIYIGASGSVENAVESYVNGELKKADNANVEGHW